MHCGAVIFIIDLGEFSMDLGRFSVDPDESISLNIAVFFTFLVSKLVGPKTGFMGMHKGGEWYAGSSHYSEQSMGVQP